jgi:hypothetical protein
MNARKGRSPRTGNRTAIWLSLALALCLHAVVFLLPALPDPPQPRVSEARIELQFSDARKAQVVPQQPAPDTPTPATEPEPLPLPEIPPQAPAPEQLAEVAPAEPRAPAARAFEPAAPNVRKPLEEMNDNERRRLADSLLGQQFIRQESVTEKVFGKPLASQDPVPAADFRLPERPSMIAMLDKPVPDLPFAYQEGLIHFAYDPGVKGDLQRFWDVITPEFGFRTKYGTEVRCIWILVIGGCAWK